MFGSQALFRGRLQHRMLGQESVAEQGRTKYTQEQQWHHPEAR